MSRPRAHIPVDPIAHFMQEHDRALQQLSSLTRATTSLAEDGFTDDAFLKVELALQFIDEEVTVHNRSEEEALFPVLERYVEGPTQHMRAEHILLRKELVRLRRSVTKARKGRGDRTAASELAAVSRSMVQLLVNHIHKENQLLFPLVRKFLTKDALREVSRLMARETAVARKPKRASGKRKRRPHA